MAEATSQLPSTSTSLLAQVRGQDAQAWHRLTHIYGPSVYRWCRTAGVQPADAADIVQEVFQAVARGVSQFRHQGDDSFRAWLWTIYRSKLMDHYRRRKIEPAAAGGSELATMIDAGVGRHVPAFGEPSKEESARVVQRALAAIRGDFHDHVWQAFWRSAALGERTRDIAEELDMTSAAVCMARARVLLRLRETLAGMGILGDDEQP
jgi:RNA polymerase sigma-70 factor (ECF subfamily)